MCERVWMHDYTIASICGTWGTDLAPNVKTVKKIAAGFIKSLPDGAALINFRIICHESWMDQDRVIVTAMCSLGMPEDEVEAHLASRYYKLREQKQELEDKRHQAYLGVIE